MTTKSPLQSYRDLIVWRRTIELVKETYRVTQLLPKTELYGLIAQMRRSAVSIAANIAEGHARRTTKDYRRFVYIANGSLRELETYWEVVATLEYVSQGELSNSVRLGDEIGRMLTKLRQALGRSTGMS